MTKISPEDCQQLLSNDNKLQIIDIREPYEVEVCKLRFKNIPMGQIPERLNELSRNEKVYLLCQSGKRAEAIGNLLETEFQFANVSLIEGGATAWNERTQNH
ncbi:MAG: hypothetical protein RL264_720 [Bacteroidota bacterium]|jgi:adenylyltransferase/sulfurtransferase